MHTKASTEKKDDIKTDLRRIGLHSSGSEGSGKHSDKTYDSIKSGEFLD